MYGKAVTTLFFFVNFISIVTISAQPVKAIQANLTNSGNSAIYDDDSNSNYYGFNDWNVDDQKLVTETGLFYRVDNSGTAQTLDNLTINSSNASSNPTTITYGDANNNDFTLDLELSLSNNGSTLAQTITVNNTSGSSLDFDLYAYFDLVTSNGNGGDSIKINISDYTATQSGDRNTITTTVTENNTSYNSRRAEVDSIDTLDDTLQKLLNDNNPQLDNHLGAISAPDNAVSFAYEWNYNLGINESFQITTTSSVSSTAVPFEFSPSLGILLSGIFGSIHYLKRKLKT